jgi:hypothetical protein
MVKDAKGGKGTKAVKKKGNGKTKAKKAATVDDGLFDDL